jgi:hypothetical protein
MSTHSHKRKAEQDQHSRKFPRLSFTPQAQNAEEAAEAAKAAAKAEAEAAKAAAEAEAEAAEAEAAAAVRISSAEATPQKAASAAAASASAAFAFATASAGNLAWMYNTTAGENILNALPKTEQSLLFQKYTKARAAAALREKASREPLTDVRTTPRKCTYCSEPIMTGKRKNNTNAFWCQKHCLKNKKKALYKK